MRPDLITILNDNNRIAGLLQVSMNIITASYNTSHNIIIWAEPFTLDITDVDPDIIGYTVCISVRDVHECGNVTATEVIVPKYYFDVNIMITAWNIIGESPAALYSIIPCTDEIQSKLYICYLKDYFPISFVATTTVHN